MINVHPISGVNLINALKENQAEVLHEAIIAGLSKPKKTLPCRLIFDLTGSKMFEEICKLQEYYVTRKERHILEVNASDIIDSVGGEVELVEFGSGSSVKTRFLINELLARQNMLHYIPIDISAKFLHETALTLVQENDRLSITAVAAEYDDALHVLPERSKQARIFLFLGSSIGQFEPEAVIELLKRVHQQMEGYDSLLIGFDLLKERNILFDAYNDSAGLTADFNKNMLARINQEFGGNFVLDEFTHHAPFVEEYARIEMRLISKCSQNVSIDGLEHPIHFEEGEYIHTENSHKYTVAGFQALCEAAGFTMPKYWQDEQKWFALCLLAPTK